MRTANLYATENGYAWDANYAQGGLDLMRAADMLRKKKAEPFVPLGRRSVHERAVEALEGYTASNARQGYLTREQAEYGKKVKPFVVKECRGKSLFDRVLDFFTYEVYDE
jgi:hypothetical protein